MKFEIGDTFRIDRKIKSIGIRYVKLHQSNRQRIRNIKLEQIGIYDSLL